ncbi:MAG: PilZ domain-containing protein [Oscillospiraceae bacterium]
MLSKDKIIKAEIIDSEGRVIISTANLEFPKDFFRIKSTEFIVLKAEKILPIAKDSPVDVVFYYLNGTRILYRTTIDLATDMQVNIHIGNNYETLEERRRFYKTETNISGNALKVIRGGELVEVDEPPIINIRDINIGGVFVFTLFKFQPGDIFELEFLDGKLCIMTEVLRSQEKEGRLGFGCKFVKLTSSQEEMISKFIFNCQLAERERRKRMN